MFAWSFDWAVKVTAPLLVVEAPVAESASTSASLVISESSTAPLPPNTPALITVVFASAKLRPIAWTVADEDDLTLPSWWARTALRSLARAIMRPRLTTPPPRPSACATDLLPMTSHCAVFPCGCRPVFGLPTLAR